MTGLVRPLVLSIGALVLAALAGGVLAQGRGAAMDRAAPEIVGGPWINSQPLTAEALRGRVVFVEFWTYG